MDDTFETNNCKKARRKAGNPRKQQDKKNDEAGDAGSLVHGGDFTRSRRRI